MVKPVNVMLPFDAETEARTPWSVTQNVPVWPELTVAHVDAIPAIVWVENVTFAEPLAAARCSAGMIWSGLTSFSSEARGSCIPLKHWGGVEDSWQTYVVEALAMMANCLPEAVASMRLLLGGIRSITKVPFWLGAVIA